ncbi:MAG: hypothetical protein ING97_11330, partial [Gemmatimonas sp.]|nr:hypothetical protein [Gemmatimonas sp.]
MDPLEGLTVTGTDPSTGTPSNVTFWNDVTVNGDLVINATGTVTFRGALHLTGGGDLIVTGASLIVFERGVTLEGLNAGVAGEVFLEGNEINLQGGEGSFVGTGVVTLRPRDLSMGIEVAQPPSESSSLLNISNTELAALGDSFSKIVIGHQSGVTNRYSAVAAAAAGAGTIRLGSVQASQQYTFRDALEVYGGTITVEDLANADHVLRVQGDLKLDASGAGGITIRNTLEASTAFNTPANITLSASTGKILQEVANPNFDNLSTEAIRAAHLVASAVTGVVLPWAQVNSLNVLNTGNGDIDIGISARDTVLGVGGDIRVDRLHQSDAAQSSAIKLATAAGTVTVAAPAAGVVGVTTAGSGAITLTAGGSGKQVVVQNVITATTGAITLTADGAVSSSGSGVISGSGASVIALTSASANISQGTNITTVNGSVSLSASTGITMTDGVETNAGASNGAVSYSTTTGNLAVSRILAGGTAGGTVSLTATAGTITDNLTGDNPNVVGDTATLTLVAGAGAGTAAAPLRSQVAELGATVTTSGGLHLRESTALATQAVTVGGSDGAITIVTLDGALTVGAAMTGTGTLGHIRLESRESAEGTAASVALNAEVSAATGSISVLSTDHLSLNSSGHVWAKGSGQSLDLQAAGAVTMNASARATSTDGNIRIEAQDGDLTLGRATTLGSGATVTGTGDISVVASGAIVDADTDGGAQATNLSGDQVRIVAGTSIGAGANAVETAASVLSAASNAGGTFLAQSSTSLSVGSVSALSVNRVTTTGTIASSTVTDSGGTVAGITVASGEALVLTSTGNVTVDSALSAPGTGHLLLSTTGTLALNGDVNAGSGHVSVVAGGAMTMAATADVVTTSTGTVDVRAASLTMTHGATLSTGSGNVRVSATGAIALGAITTTGDVSLSGSTITDAFASGTDTVNVTADELRIVTTGTASGNGAGTGANHLEVDVAKLAADVNGTGTGGLFLTESSALDIGTLNDINVNQVGSNGTTLTATTDTALSEVDSDANLVIVTLAGSLQTLATGGAVTASGNMLLKAGGATSDLTLGAVVTNTSSGGHTSLDAERDVLQNANVVALESGKSVDVLAGRHITMADATSISTTDGNVLLHADTGNVTLESISAGTAGVSISAVATTPSASAGAIVDRDADGDTEVDVTAGSLILRASHGVGTGANHLETTVSTVAASAAAGGLFLTETSGLTVDSLTIAVNRVGSDATVPATPSGTATLTLEDFSTSADGALVLRVTAGDLTVNGGTASTSSGVTAAGTGNALLSAGGAIELNGD